jgi:hypothetical protein
MRGGSAAARSDRLLRGAGAAAWKVCLWYEGHSLEQCTALRPHSVQRYVLIRCGLATSYRLAAGLLAGCMADCVCLALARVLCVRQAMRHAMPTDPVPMPPNGLCSPHTITCVLSTKARAWPWHCQHFQNIGAPFSSLLSHQSTVGPSAASPAARPAAAAPGAPRAPAALLTSTTRARPAATAGPTCAHRRKKSRRTSAMSIRDLRRASTISGPCSAHTGHEGPAAQDRASGTCGAGHRGPAARAQETARWPARPCSEETTCTDPACACNACRVNSHMIPGNRLGAQAQRTQGGQPVRRPVHWPPFRHRPGAAAPNAR